MSEVARYTKRPVTIEAMQLSTFSDFTRAVKWIRDNGGNVDFATFSSSGLDGTDYLLINTLEGTMEAPTGWWVIRGVKGEFYACEPEIFALSYEEAPLIQDVTQSLTGTGDPNAG